MVTPLKTDTLIVSRRDPETRRHSRVGVLSSTNTSSASTTTTA